MRSFAILLTALALTGSLYGQSAAPAEPAQSPESATAQPLPLSIPLLPELPNLSPSLDFEFRVSCSTQRTLCFNGCPTSDPEKTECFQNCQCQYLRCIGASCTT
jgi:hypothetical protein